MQKIGKGRWVCNNEWYGFNSFKMEYVNLTSEKGKKYKELSGGMKRRLSLALTLINNPSIIIADEPTTGVDPYERIRMRELLLNLSQIKTVIVSTHIIEDILYMCHELTVLNAGKMYFNGELDSLLSYIFCSALILCIYIK